MTAPTGLPHFRGANVPPPPGGRGQLPVAGDIALAVGLLVLDVLGAVVAFVLGIEVSGDWKPFDPGADNSDVTFTFNWLYVGIAGGIVLLTAALLCLLRAVVSASLQVLAGMVVVVLAVNGAQFDKRHEDRARTAVSAPAAYR
ncbi:hypothetical protein EJ357_15135 [Streptomyces cyaneochromogenes]|uniref:DUF6234 domain-containing protein n=1 Tax=Streptomyces cyaneochromogenes TaxID=2496836 RepID=A0A3S9M645_9ACTN|nr:DUF6234 family protein [Streptomyces cyaneochromogenes]AZQ34647.1 hypothetical protein EJ357_15135 [Streptomyces cyaneochromogenes]